MLAMIPYAISGICRHAALNEIFSLFEKGLTPATGGAFGAVRFVRILRIADGYERPRQGLDAPRREAKNRLPLASIIQEHDRSKGTSIPTSSSKAVRRLTMLGAGASAFGELPFT
jgi:hypothetical protein